MFQSELQDTIFAETMNYKTDNYNPIAVYNLMDLPMNIRCEL